ncbi:MAG: hypothetical protein Fur0021_29370 [Candidatus Promineifilaceae bacterium]
MTIYTRFTVTALFFTLLLIPPPSPFPKDIPVGSPAVKYIDPEFSSDNDAITFRTTWLHHGEAWVGWLNPQNGELVSPTGQDYWLANKLAPIDDLSDNGPEWMRHNGVYGVLYTRIENDVQRMYFWSTQSGQAQLIGSSHDPISRTHYAGTNAPSGPAKILYQRRQYPYGPLEVYWLDLSAPTVEHHLPDVSLEISLPIWINHHLILYSKPVGDTFQLVQYNTLSQSEIVLTHDEGDKLGPYAWSAPEMGGQYLYLAAVRLPNEPQPRRVRIYHALEQTELQLLAELEAPPDAGNHQNFSSPEPFVYQGHSYISLVLAPNIRTETSICVFPLPTHSDGIPQRVDDPNLQEIKLDPESYITRYGAYIYYYYNDYNWPAQTHLRRCLFLPTQN